jgi:hypothetical protein
MQYGRACDELGGRAAPRPAASGWHLPCPQAEKFRSKAQKSDQFRSGQQFCRYLYYLGRIRTIQLEYPEAKDCLQQASQRAHAQLAACHYTPVPLCVAAVAYVLRCSAGRARACCRAAGADVASCCAWVGRDLTSPCAACAVAQALRRAPSIAHGFRITVSKWLILVRTAHGCLLVAASGLAGSLSSACPKHVPRWQPFCPRSRMYLYRSV